jgi:DNA helicase-2/ATP-dependent DNA helicase PcrA
MQNIASAIQLTSEQQQIVTAAPGHYVITAVAGSGKTTTLAHRIKYLLEHGYDAKRILILMFNKAARVDFSHKLQRVINNATNLPEVRTFHAMGYRLYQRFIKEGYLPAFKSQILSDKEIDFHIWRFLNQILDKDALKEAKRNKKDYVEISHQFIESVKNGLKSPEATLKHLRLGEKFAYLVALFEHFEHWRKQQARISYTDMLYDPVVAIQTFPELEQLVSNKMDIVLVDEYQDTNDIQHALLKYISGERAKITIVGDPDQTIYEFRGAKPDYIIRGFAQEFPDATLLSLSYSFRYGHKISLLANHLISKNAGRQSILCKSHSGNPHTNIFCHYRQDDAQAITEIAANMTMGELDNSAILARVWSQTVGIELALLEKGIPYHIDGHSGVFHSTETQSLRTIIELSANFFSQFSPIQRQEKLDLLCHFPHVGLPDAQIKALCYQLAQHDSAWGNMLKQSIPGDLNKIQTVKLERLADALTSLETEQHSVTHLLSHYFQKTALFEGIRSLSLSHDHAEEKIASIQGVARFMSKQNSDAKSTLLLLDHLQESAARQHQQALQICTIHRAKGLEWETIFIPGLNSKILPYSYKADALSTAQLESERRLLYVAMTRSKQNLHLCLPKTQNSNTQTSRFEHELNLKQSIKLGDAIETQQTVCHFDALTGMSNISKRYSKEMNCLIKVQENGKAEKTENVPAIWFASKVAHCMLGQGYIKEENSNSFSVEFMDKQIRTFSKETAERFFSVVE